jgi:transaldolase
LPITAKSPELLRADGGNCEEILAKFVAAGVDLQGLAARLQKDGAASFVKSWHSLMAVIASKSAMLTNAT